MLAYTKKKSLTKTKNKNGCSLKLHSVVLCAIIGVSGTLRAQDNAIDAFILQGYTPTYDCPTQQTVEQVELYLQSDDLTTQQSHALTSMQTHGQICAGKNDIAEQKLITLINEADIDKTSFYYASSIYQLGFIHDVKGGSQHCEYYQTAQTLGTDAYPDVSLSASLGLITECSGKVDEGVRLGKLFTLLEQYSETDNPGAVAHIHNNIGLLFAKLGQNVLAAEQYLKAHEIGLDIYTGSNKLTILISAITAFTASDDFVRAKDAIDEFRRINADINTPLTNFFQLWAEAGYYYGTEQYDELRQSLQAWEAMKSDINSETYENLFDWYAASLCLVEQDKECLRQFLIDEEQTSASYRSLVAGSKDYLRFKTEVHLTVGNLPEAKEAFTRFADSLFKTLSAHQSSSRIIGVANLHSQINSLENRLAQEQKNKNRLLTIGLILVLTVLFASALYLRRYLHTQSAIDSVTQLLNNRTALRRIEKIDSPSHGKTNALAIFDLGNFKEVNRLVGSTKADYVLQQIAKTLKDVTRTTDILGRFAPEQFILCLPNIEEETAKSFFERINFALENTSLGDETNEDISVRSSMSIYISSTKFGDLSDILDDMLRSLSIQNNVHD